jgi:hypothetical protein
VTTKVAVIGSCVSRDMFNSNFIPNYKEYFDCILTQSHASFITLMSDPVPVDEYKIDNLLEHDVVNVVNEHNKKLIDKLRDLKPDVILIDFFADVHFGVIKLSDGMFLTNNRWKIYKTTYYNEIKRYPVIQIDQNFDEFSLLWKKYVDKFFEFAASELPNVMVVLNHAKFIDKYVVKDSGNIELLSNSGKCKSIDVNASNFYWELLSSYCINKYNVKHIDLTHNDYIAVEDHIWGPFYVHYCKDYYYDTMHELIKIVQQKDRICQKP